MENRVLRLGIAGLGHVGSALIQLIERQSELRLAGEITLTGVSARNKSRQRLVDISKYDWFDDPIELAQSDDIDVFVELIGGSDGPAKKAVEAAIASGKHIVTANKALLAEHGMELAEQAEKSGVNLYYEAAVAGAVPIIRAMQASLSGSMVNAISGILNGTCNYLLTEMLDNGTDYEPVLAEAQRLGYAESDPTLDVSGMDAAHKIAILSAIGYGATLDFSKVQVSGVEGFQLLDLRLADKLGYVIKLIAEGVRSPTGVMCSVAPRLLERDHPLASVKGSLNAVLVDADPSGPLTFIGAGAGPGPTASAVMGDISRLFKSDVWPAFGMPVQRMTAEFTAPTPKVVSESPYFIRAMLKDVAGALASLSEALAKADVSVDRLIQDSAEDTGGAPVAITTHPCSVEKAEQAVHLLGELDCVMAAPRLIRIAK